MLGSTFFRKLWDSPMFMTWLNIGSRMVSLLVVLPMVLRRFDPADISLYYLFASIISLQLMCGSGFVPTLARFVTFVLAGARLEDLVKNRLGRSVGLLGNRALAPETLAVLLATMRRTFAWVVAISTPLAAVIGTLLLVKPVGQSPDATAAWGAWIVVIVATPFVLLSNRYSAFLQGANRIALDQRWSALFVIFGAVSGVSVMLAGGGLFALILANQLWQVAGFFRLRWLSAKILRDLAPALPKAKPSRECFSAVWPAAWRSLVGVLAINGVTSALGLMFAQFLAPKPLAELLLGVRIITLIAEISRAPFYSRIPRFNALRAEGRINELASLAMRSMRIAYLAFVVMALLAPVVASVALPLIGSQIDFPSSGFWFWLAGAHLIERMGAMHVQLYSTTNHIVWHWLNGISGLCWILLLLLLLPRYGLIAYPCSMLIAYLLCYSTLAVRFSLRSINWKYWMFEKKSFVPAAVGYVAGALLLSSWLHP